MATVDGTTAAVDLEVDWFLALLLFLQFRVPHSRLPGVGRRGCATVARAMGNKLERRFGRRQLHFIVRGCSRRPLLLGMVPTRESSVTLRLNPHPSHKTKARRVGHSKVQRRSFGWCGGVGHPPGIQRPRVQKQSQRRPPKKEKQAAATNSKATASSKATATSKAPS